MMQIVDFNLSIHLAAERCVLVSRSNQRYRAQGQLKRASTMKTFILHRMIPLILLLGLIPMYSYLTSNHRRLHAPRSLQVAKEDCSEVSEADTLTASLTKQTDSKVEVTASRMVKSVKITKTEQTVTKLDQQVEEKAKVENSDSFTHLTGDTRIFAIANAFARAGKPILISVVNNAFLPLAHSWLCNTEFMGIHEQVVLIVPDVTSRQDLERKWPKIHIVDVTHLGQNQRALNFSTAGYVRMMVYRTRLLNELLMRNVDLFLFEVDAVWFRNPVKDIQKRLGSSDDIAVVLVSGFKNIFAGGLVYLRASEKTKILWAELTRQMNTLNEQIKKKPDGFKISEGTNDQMFLSKLIEKKYANIQITLLPGNVYADGKWYTQKKKNQRPVLINNNWVIGRDTKIARAIAFKHWFWNMTSQSCDVDLVRRTAV